MTAAAPPPPSSRGPAAPASAAAAAAAAAAVAAPPAAATTAPRVTPPTSYTPPPPESGAHPPTSPPPEPTSLPAALAAPLTRRSSSTTAPAGCVTGRCGRCLPQTGRGCLRTRPCRALSALPRASRMARRRTCRPCALGRGMWGEQGRWIDEGKGGRAGGEGAWGGARIFGTVAAPCGRCAGRATSFTCCRRLRLGPTDFSPSVPSRKPPPSAHLPCPPLLLHLPVLSCHELPSPPPPFLPCPPSYRVFVEGGTAYIRSDAPLRIAARLSPAARVAATAALAAPRLLRDGAYDTVAVNRYDWFGTSSGEGVGGVLTPEQRARFYLD